MTARLTGGGHGRHASAIVRKHPIRQIERIRALDIQTSDDVSRVDSYHDALDNDAEGALDRLFDWGLSSDERWAPCAARRAAALNAPSPPNRWWRCSCGIGSAFLYRGIRL